MLLLPKPFHVIAQAVLGSWGHARLCRGHPEIGRVEWFSVLVAILTSMGFKVHRFEAHAWLVAALIIDWLLEAIFAHRIHAGFKADRLELDWTASPLHVLIFVLFFECLGVLGVWTGDVVSSWVQNLILLRFFYLVYSNNGLNIPNLTIELAWSRISQLLLRIKLTHCSTVWAESNCSSIRSLRYEYWRAWLFTDSSLGHLFGTHVLVRPITKFA